MWQILASLGAHTLFRGENLQFGGAESGLHFPIDLENSEAVNMENYVRESRRIVGTGITEVWKQVIGLGDKLESRLKKF